MPDSPSTSKEGLDNNNTGGWSSLIAYIYISVRRLLSMITSTSTHARLLSNISDLAYAIDYSLYAIDHSLYAIDHSLFFFLSFLTSLPLS
jgi:hypothetical protein